MLQEEYVSSSYPALNPGSDPGIDPNFYTPVVLNKINPQRIYSALKMDYMNPWTREQLFPNSTQVR